ncbi:uncharacterized protein [Blastocystis hominis]|uniref:Uncharacterized protein n=1 Tax=Blastocystis hominis TaxID=12968 RepID=D8M134_BLAHO|nr:uncharacterized protein [Blastocystis hominis]CBK21773.2 unnamed protein product [Blastocystis hominis]|eukprot:XP_012895821.1 uncharacterized protein [Blastocystis hominis]
MQIESMEYEESPTTKEYLIQKSKTEKLNKYSCCLGCYNIKSYEQFLSGPDVECEKSISHSLTN